LCCSLHGHGAWFHIKLTKPKCFSATLIITGGASHESALSPLIGHVGLHTNITAAHSRLHTGHHSSHPSFISLHKNVRLSQSTSTAVNRLKIKSTITSFKTWYSFRWSRNAARFYCTWLPPLDYWLPLIQPTTTHQRSLKVHFLSSRVPRHKLHVIFSMVLPKSPIPYSLIWSPQ
jgi:hypothetical protein